VDAARVPAHRGRLAGPLPRALPSAGHGGVAASRGVREREGKMNASRPRVAGILAALAFALFFTFAAATAAGADGAGWVCPPCGASCDTIHFDHAGTCPQCGMELVAANSPAAQQTTDRKRVAILVFEGVQIIDFSGPYEMFGASGAEVFTVAAAKT